MPPAWTLSPQLVALFWAAVEPVGGGLFTADGLQGQALMIGIRFWY